MKKITTKVSLKNEEMDVTIEQMAMKESDDSEYYYLHNKGNMIAVIRYKDCSFEVISGDYTLKELKQLCKYISKLKEENS